MKSKHSQETFKSQNHRNTHTHAVAVHVDRANTVCVTHTFGPTHWQPQAAPAPPTQDHPQVMFMNWEEWMDASIFHHFPLPYPGLYQRAANTNVLISLCAGNSAIVLWFMSVLMKSYCADRDQRCSSIGWWETVMQSESMWKSLIIDGWNELSWNSQRICMINTSMSVCSQRIVYPCWFSLDMSIETLFLDHITGYFVKSNKHTDLLYCFYFRYDIKVNSLIYSLVCIKWAFLFLAFLSGVR